MTNKIFIIDGYSFLFRAYHSMPPLTNPQGTPVGAIYGFTNMMLKLCRQHQPEYMVITLDSGQKTFRNDIYAEYKANRPPAPDDLIPQFSLVRDASLAMSIPVVEKTGYEADDLIATIVKSAEKEGLEAVIVSSDKDLMQLVNDKTKMYDAMRDRLISEVEVQEKFGVKPNKVLDILSLMGDSSDNIPGVPSIGPKTAAELINNFGSLDEVLARAGEVKQNKRREVLIEYKEQALLSRELATLKEDVDLENKIEDYKAQPFLTDKLKDFLNLHGFTSILAKLGQKPKDGPKDLTTLQKDNVKESVLSGTDKDTASDIPDPKIEIISSIDQFNTAADFILQQDNVALSYIPNLAICFFTKELAYFLRIDAKDSAVPDDLLSFNSNESRGLSWALIEDKWHDIMQAKHVNKLLFNAKEFIHLFGNNICSYEDVDLMYYVANTGLYSGDINQLSKQLGVPLFNISELLGSGKNKLQPQDLSDEDLARVIIQKAKLIYVGFDISKQSLFKKNLLSLYYSLDKKLLNVVQKMEQYGAYIDVNFLRSLTNDFSSKINTLESEVYALSGTKFNIGSPKQLGEVLFTKLDLKPSKKNAKLSTSVEILEDLVAQGHEIAAKVLQWRHFAKLISTYTESLPKQINTETGSVHTNFNLTNTATGRFSSTEPNLQNIPIRTEEGKKIRQAFIARTGNKLISADYSQIELRLLAHVANISSLKQAFADGIDIHSLTASEVFGIKLEDVNAVTRRSAKAINFGIIYGISSFGLKERLGISIGEAKSYIESYFAKFPGIRQYMDDTKDFCRTHGYVETILGRKCYIKGINDKNGAVRAFSDRAAINAPLQGSASDIIKTAMLNLNNCVEQNTLDANMLIQVHDELIFEVKEENAEAARTKIVNIMQDSVKLSLPLIVDANIGDNWNEIH